MDHTGDSQTAQITEIPQGISAAAVLTPNDMQLLRHHTTQRDNNFDGILPRFENGQSSALSTDTATAARARLRERPKESDPNYTPVVSTTKVLSVAERLGCDPIKWRDRPDGPGKCNLYLDAVMKGAGMPRPWSQIGVQSCEKLDRMLANDPRYDRVWQNDYSSCEAYRTAYKIWDRYVQPVAGDICLWATHEAVHAALADGKGGLYYAGARDHKKRGFNHRPVGYFTGTSKYPTQYGPPTSIYRYKYTQP